jgi:hypothetical protein
LLFHQWRGRDTTEGHVICRHGKVGLIGALTDRSWSYLGESIGRKAAHDEGELINEKGIIEMNITFHIHP